MSTSNISLVAFQEYNLYIDGSVQERRNSIANPLELHLSCTNLAIWKMNFGERMSQDSQ